ncbi:hypothetical protein GGU10DRAFT_279975, partial [Lentinula aff. detonsa]
RWLKMMNDRLEMDCDMTNGRYERKALSKRLVLQTWKGTLSNEKSLPKDWIEDGNSLPSCLK